MRWKGIKGRIGSSILANTDFVSMFLKVTIAAGILLLIIPYAFWFLRTDMKVDIISEGILA